MPGHDRRARLTLCRLEERNAASDTLSYLLHAGLGFGAMAYLNSLGSDRDTAFGSSGVISSAESLSANQRSLFADAPTLSAVSPDFLSQGRQASGVLQDWLREQSGLDQNKAPAAIAIGPQQRLAGRRAADSHSRATRSRPFNTAVATRCRRELTGNPGPVLPIPPRRPLQLRLRILPNPGCPATRPPRPNRTACPNCVCHPRQHLRVVRRA